jgi:hypothetical protein
MPPCRTKERSEGNLKKAVESFIEWLILGLAVCSTERIQKYCSLKYLKTEAHDLKRGRETVSLQSPILLVML